MLGGKEGEVIVKDESLSDLAASYCMHIAFFIYKNSIVNTRRKQKKNGVESDVGVGKEFKEIIISTIISFGLLLSKGTFIAMVSLQYYGDPDQGMSSGRRISHMRSLFTSLSLLTLYLLISRSLVLELTLFPHLLPHIHWLLLYVFILYHFSCSIASLLITSIKHHASPVAELEKAMVCKLRAKQFGQNHVKHLHN